MSADLPVANTTTSAVPEASLTAIDSVSTVTLQGRCEQADWAAVEEPLEIRLVHGPEGAREVETVSVTMRTPGDDFELAAGLLLAEGIVAEASQIRTISYFGAAAAPGRTSNIVRVELKPANLVDLAAVERRFVTSASCGVCGKTSLEALQLLGIQSLAGEASSIRSEVIHSLPELLRGRQPIFHRTGGVHGAALADNEGRLLDVREDVGRHNAVDKLIGRQFLTGGVPLTQRIMVVSGRVSFDIMQKALVARIPVVVAVGCPSSLAIDMARQFGMTLIGFASDQRYNVYSQPQRVDFDG